MKRVLGLELKPDIPNLKGKKLSKSVLSNAEELVTFIKHSTNGGNRVDLLGKALLRTRDGRERQVYIFYVPGCDKVDSYLGIMPA